MSTLNLNQPRPTALIPDCNLISLYNLAISTPPGDFLELGVFKGGSAWVLQQALNTRLAGKLNLFDTFTGIPEKTEGLDAFGIGSFNETNVQDVMAAIPEAVFYVGRFPGTLPEVIPPLAFVHIDCDQYESCRLAIEKLWPHVLPGGVMAFDDYPFAGIKKAIHDYFEGGPSFTPTNMPYVRKAAG